MSDCDTTWTALADIGTTWLFQTCAIETLELVWTLLDGTTPWEFIDQELTWTLIE